MQPRAQSIASTAALWPPTADPGDRGARGTETTGARSGIRRLLARAAGLLVLVGGVGLARAEDPKARAEHSLLEELAILDRAVEVHRAGEALAQERESLSFVETLTRASHAEVARRFRSHHARAGGGGQDPLRARVRLLYRLARGGASRLVFDGQADGARRLTRLFALRRLIDVERRELAVHSRAAQRERDELVGVVRERAAVALLGRMQDAETHVLALATARSDEELERARSLRRWALARADLDAAGRRTLAQIHRTRARLARHRGLDLLEPDALARPTTGRVAGAFGAYEDATTHVRAHRQGIELHARPREPVRAIAAGRVAAVATLAGYDRVVVIDHGAGYHSLTGRLLQTDVKVGDEVTAGAVLGVPSPKTVPDGLGLTVYLEVRHGERAIDPAPYLGASPSKTMASSAPRGKERRRQRAVTGRSGSPVRWQWSSAASPRTATCSALDPARSCGLPSRSGATLDDP